MEKGSQTQEQDKSIKTNNPEKSTWRNIPGHLDNIYIILISIVALYLHQG